MGASPTPTGATASSASPVPAVPPLASGVLELVEGARTGLLRAGRAEDVRERHLHAHLAALRAAAALVAGRRTPPAPRPPAPRTLWELLPGVAPELAEWSAFFAHATTRRWQAEPVSAREADDLLRQAETFVGIVHRRLGLPRPAAGPQLLAPTPASSGPGRG